MIFQLLVIGSLAGIVVIVMRRMPASESGGFTLPKFKLSRFGVPRIRFSLPKLSIPKITLPFGSLHFPKVNLPELKPERPIMHDDDPLSQADLAFTNKRFEDAEGLYVHAAARHPQDPKIYARLGVIYLQQKNHKDARDALLTSLKFDDTVASRHFNLALAYQGMGLPHKALAAVKQALDLDSKNEKYQALRQKLESSQNSEVAT